jgi:cell fate regulator YaaT (PSP1 superfamily)
MPIVVGIRFKDSGKTYFFDPHGLEQLAIGDSVIVETVRGLELAKITHLPHEVADTEIVGELKPVIRRAEDSDFERMRLLSERHEEVLARCDEKIREHSLPMRLIKAGSNYARLGRATKRSCLEALAPVAACSAAQRSCPIMRAYRSKWRKTRICR